MDGFMHDYETIANGAGEVIRIEQRPTFANPISGAQRSWQAAIDAAEEWLDAHGLNHYDIDEIALHFHDDDLETMLAFLTAAVKEEGVQMFNAAGDHVKVPGFNTEYFVDYYFLSVPWRPGLRVEVMRKDAGASPVHDSLPEHYGQPAGVHLSFKTGSRSEYQDAVKSMDSAYGTHRGAALVQACRSTYGEFSYHRVPAQVQMCGMYLKPRVNLRDDTRIYADNIDQGVLRGMPTVGSAGRDVVRPIKDSPQA